MNILIVGGEQNAYYLIKSLKAKGHEVVAVNHEHDQCQMLADKYGIKTICGNGSNANTLQEAHAEKMDAVIALYKQDAANLIVSELAKKQFNVKYTFAIVNDPKNAELFQGFGVDKCVNATLSFIELIEQQAIAGSIKKYLPAEDCKVMIFDVLLTEKSPAANKKLWEIGFPPQSIITCILRGEEIILPQGNTILMAGDKVVIISSSQSREQTIALLTGEHKK
ncbi:MAG: TrkA family potassium uptake protein [Clostridia bacterium]